jgi:CBS domain-containing protein
LFCIFQGKDELVSERMATKLRFGYTRDTVEKVSRTMLQLNIRHLPILDDKVRIVFFLEMGQHNTIGEISELEGNLQPSIHRKTNGKIQ